MSEQPALDDLFLAIVSLMGGTITSPTTESRGRTWTFTPDPDALYAGLVKEFGQAKVDELQAAYEACETFTDRYLAYQRVMG